ncbi:MAG: PRC-barrel domain-containing protein [Armatimonadota bacterium]|jgi:uncharacterized protein YrrD
MIAVQELTGKSVVSTAEGKVLGKIRQCVCHLAMGEVVGLLVDASDRLLGEKAIAGKDIGVIGEDAVLVASEKLLVDVADVKGMGDLVRPEEADPMTVFTTGGRRLGSVGRIMIDRKQKAVVCFELTEGPLRDLAEGPSMMPIVEGIVHGEDSILVPPDAAEKVAAGEGAITRMWRGVSQRLTQLAREHAAAQPAPKGPKKAVEAQAAKPKKKAKKAAAKPKKKPAKAKPKKKVARKKARKRA